MQTQCKKCVMDKSAEEFKIDSNGICNFCHQAQKSLKEIQGLTLPVIKGKKYDCLLGLSGGVDSSYLLHEIVKRGLKPLCFSVDNGWNKPTSDENILKMVEKLKVPFYRYTIDLKKFTQLQSAFMSAGQKNIEIPTDHILMATSYELASKYGIKYILSGGNVATESIMPPSWGYNARDLVHIKDIFKKITGKKLKGLPTCSLFKFNYYQWLKGIRIIYPLDVWGYDRAKAIKILEYEYNWIDYGNKHEENIFTDWFQNFYLFEKFNIDKRKAHLSSMINSGQITREEGMRILQQNPIFPYLGLEKDVMRYKKRPYTDFKTDERLYSFISKVVRFLRKCSF